MEMVTESQDVNQAIERLLEEANALSLGIPRFKVVLCMLQLAEMRACLQHGDEMLVLVRKEVIPSLKAIKDITCYLTTERVPQRVEAGCYCHLRDTPIITDQCLKAKGSALACDLIFLSRRDGRIIDCVAANFVGVS